MHKGMELRKFQKCSFLLGRYAKDIAMMSRDLIHYYCSFSND